MAATQRLCAAEGRVVFLVAARYRVGEPMCCAAIDYRPAPADVLLGLVEGGGYGSFGPVATTGYVGSWCPNQSPLRGTLMSGLFASLSAAAARAPYDRAGGRGPQRMLAEFPTYAGAEELVDRLSDKGFPVEHTRIVGTDLRSVEDVTGRLTTRDATVAGAASGAWLGLLLGVLIGMFSSGSQWFGVLVGSSFTGAVWLGAFGFFAHRVTRGRRDFSSLRKIEAGTYAVEVDAEHVDAALRLGGLI
jgi:hypothetical protein